MSQTVSKAAIKTGKKKNELLETIVVIVEALIIALLFRSFLYQPFSIPTASMQQTLMIGDYFLANKWAWGFGKYSFPVTIPFNGRILGSEPQRGDVAVFRNEITNEDYIKRVIGLPGDRIQMIDGILHINNTPVKRERIADFVTTDAWGRAANAIQYRETLPNGVSHNIIEREGDTGTFDNTPVFTVPAGHFFMMGDNRDNSLDSRDRSVGYVPFENFVGRAEIIFFSIDEGASAWRIWEWPWTVRWTRMFSTIK